MTPRDTVNGWLKELSRKSGIDLTLDENDACALRYGENLDCMIELPDQSSVVYFSAQILNVAGLDTEQRATLYERLLQLNYYCLETGGATFALDTKAGRAILCYGQPIGTIDAPAFENLLGNFLETAEKWRSELSGVKAGKPEEEKPMEEGDDSLRLIQFKA